LLPISQHVLKYRRHLGDHGYEGIALDIDGRRPFEQLAVDAFRK